MRRERSHKAAPISSAQALMMPFWEGREEERRLRKGSMTMAKREPDRGQPWIIPERMRKRISLALEKATFREYMALTKVMKPEPAILACSTSKSH